METLRRRLLVNMGVTRGLSVQVSACPAWLCLVVITRSGESLRRRVPEADSAGKATGEYGCNTRRMGTGISVYCIGLFLVVITRFGESLRRRVPEGDSAGKAAGEFGYRPRHSGAGISSVLLGYS